MAHDISAYSLVALACEAAPLMTNGGSIVAMTYYGAEKVVPHYNVMGVAKASLEASTRYLAYDLGPKRIRVNCISAGPVNTLAARGISGFMSMLKHYQERAPLRRSCDPAELGATGVFLASDAAAAITGQVIYVDGPANDFESNIIWRAADLLGVSSRQRIEIRQLVAADRTTG